MVYLSGDDYDDRAKLLEKLHKRSVNNINSGDVVISAGLAEYSREKDTRIRSVFERADAAMYLEKMTLKRMGAATR